MRRWPGSCASWSGWTRSGRWPVAGSWRRSARGDVHAGDGQRTTTAWLVHALGLTKAQAAAYLAEAGLARGHAALLAGLRKGLLLTASVAVQVARWVREIPAEFRQEAGGAAGRGGPAGAGPDVRGDPGGDRPGRTRAQRCHDTLAGAMRRLGFCILIGTVGRPGAPLLRAGAYGPSGRGLLRGGIGPCPAGARDWPGLAGAAGRSRPRSKDTRRPPGRRERAALGQRVNFAGVSSDRRVKAQTAAW